ncbi:MAG: RrF2 family transcriptional regulator [Polaribacter sp.]|uniref:RrF2 family transcriptional regulator n=1 Tax=Polaribacter sp. TaxID=1920175 RepID=UPI003EF9D929
MLSNSSKYAIRAVLYLVKKATKENKIGSKQIALELDMPAPFLAKTLQKLVKNKIISSIKGPKGGFYLNNQNKKKTVFDIINCIDNVEKFDLCYLGTLECNEEKPCIVHHLYYPFKKELIKKLKSKTILEVANEISENSNLSQFL